MRCEIVFPSAYAPIGRSGHQRTARVPAGGAVRACATVAPVADSPIFALLDASGSGVCRLGAGDTVQAASAGFRALTGLDDDCVGKSIAALLPDLPELGTVPERAAEDAPMFRQVGADGVARELVPVRIPSDAEASPYLVLVDRSGVARLLRSQATLGRRLEDLQAELEARARSPERPRVRTMTDLATRLEDAISRARRYEHAVTCLRVRCGKGHPEALSSLDSTIMGCIRGVDEVGTVGEGEYVVVLPHTDLAGGKVVAERVITRLGKQGHTAACVGAAQLIGDEGAHGLVRRAEAACDQADQRGGGVLLAVDVL